MEHRWKRGRWKKMGWKEPGGNELGKGGGDQNNLKNIKA
jgi:hypothetical protein